MNLSFNKEIINVPKLDLELRGLTTKYQYLTQKGVQLTLVFSTLLTQDEIDAVSNKINNFVEISLTDTLANYMESRVYPFINNMMYRIQAENIAMGITQAGKTADVLGFLCQATTLPGKTRAISFKQTIDTGSLTVTVELLTYYINNPDLYSDLAPYVTADRLTTWKISILAFLAQPV